MMRSRRSRVAFAVTALSAATLCAASSPPTDQWNAAWIAGDASQLSALYTEDARVMTPNFPSVTGREDIQAMFTRMMGRNMTMSSTVIEDLESGDLWVRRTDFEMLFGGQHTDDGEAVEIWRKIDGRWLLHLEIFTSRTIRPIAYDDPAPEYDRIRFKPAPTQMNDPADSGGPGDSEPAADPDPVDESQPEVVEDDPPD